MKLSGPVQKQASDAARKMGVGWLPFGPAAGTRIKQMVANLNGQVSEYNETAIKEKLLPVK